MALKGRKETDEILGIKARSATEEEQVPHRRGILPISDAERGRRLRRPDQDWGTFVEKKKPGGYPPIQPKVPTAQQLTAFQEHRERFRAQA